MKDAYKLEPQLIAKEVLDDPVVPRAGVNPRTLENWTVNSKAWYVDNCGRNAKALYSMMKLLPKEKVDPYAGWKSKLAIFPRSEQYEYRYIEETRKRNSKNLVEEHIPPKCSAEVETSPRFQLLYLNNYTKIFTVDFDHPEYKFGDKGFVFSVPIAPAFEYTKTPIWWQEKIPNRIECAVGLPDDYAFQGLDRTGAAENTFDREKQSRENPRSYVPGAIYRQEIQDKNETQESRNRADHAVKVAITGEGEHPKDSGNCDCSLYYTPHKSLEHKTEDRDLKKSEVDPAVELDPRWNLRHGICGTARNDGDRKNAMLNLHRPYHHEINTWYARNKPAKLLPPLIFEGKRPILEWHFSNL